MVARGGTLVSLLTHVSARTSTDPTPMHPHPPKIHLGSELVYGEAPFFAESIGDTYTRIVNFGVREPS